jgi:integrase
MGRSIHRLSAVGLRKLPAERVMLSDGGGLYLSVIPPNASSWVFRYMVAGQQRVMGLGSYPAVSLAVARDMAADARKLRMQGRDPLQEKRERAASVRAEAAKLVTFDQCVTDYIAAHRKSWTNPKHAAQWDFTLGAYASPIIGKLPVASIDTGLVLKVLRQKTSDDIDLWTAIPETASRLRGRIESILDFARVHEYRHGENPARWKGHLKNLLPARNKVRDVKHLDAMDYTLVADFMVDLGSLDSAEARALEFAVLTAGRSGEVLGARWSEIDLTAKTWTIAGSRMKSGRPHRSILSDAATAILKGISPTAELVFTRRGRKLPVNSLRLLMRAMGRTETVHGFRASFKTWATECTAYPRELIEFAMAHSVTDAFELAYQRGEQIEKRRRLMNDWARHCAVPASGEVVPLQARG